MKTSKRLPLLSALLAMAPLAPVSAQGVEPTADVALVRLSERLSTELLLRLPDAKSLAVAPKDRASRGVARAAALALSSKGFALAEGDAADVFTEWGETQTIAGGTLVVVARVEGEEPIELRCGFGDASWATSIDGLRVVRGGEASTREAALKSAGAALRSAAAARFPNVARSAADGRRIARAADAAEVFVRSNGERGDVVYEAFARLSKDGERDLSSAEARLLRRGRLATTVKTGATVVVAAVCFLLFRLFDWRTRGWRTRPLRVAFGTLFAAAVFGLWRIPV
jgi:hypothetical protein